MTDFKQLIDKLDGLEKQAENCLDIEYYEFCRSSSEYELSCELYKNWPAISNYIKEQDARLKLLTEQLTAAEGVVDAARGFKVHGEAKNGTHAGLLFAALAA